MHDDIPTLHDVYSVVRRWADHNGINAVKLVIIQGNGDQLPLTIQGGDTKKTLVESTSRTSRGPSKEMFRSVLRAVPDHDQDAITFQGIKNRCGYSDDSAIYKCLRRLIELGRIERASSKYRKCPRGDK